MLKIKGRVGADIEMYTKKCTGFGKLSVILPRFYNFLT